MRRAFLLLAATCALGMAELAMPTPAQGQSMSGKEGTVEYLMNAKDNKRKKRRMQMAVYGVLGIIGCGVVIYLVLNSVEQRAARRAIMAEVAERQAAGLM